MKLTRLPFSPGCPPSFVLIDLEFEESEDVDQSNILWRPAHAVLLSRILAANTHRLRTFEISSNIWQPIEGLASSLIDVPMPFLQSWTVIREKAQWGREFSSDLQSDAVTRAIECAPGATPSAELSDKMYPNLRVLTLQGTYQRWAQLIPRHLVELNLKHLPRNRRPTFNQLKIFLLGNQSILESLHNGNITLPKLRTLSLGFNSKSVSAERSLMTYLVLPKLLNLEIYDLADYNPSNITDDADEDILSMLSWLGLDDCYWHMIEYLPLNQITKLILRSSYHELSAFDRFDEACLRQRGDSVPEVPKILIQLFATVRRSRNFI
ncbi:hypothetical protein F5878DRAFT_664909 [Lentinula raphanica]|uniref:Uncharacterized protein n=1 Tax=Lentinula raphanica TaxID=153919 RepID=A0AA38UDL9_9AGAR|nr:hypothetical protein F5878DRAFT_664909 [Lentinula raphanica]